MQQNRLEHELMEAVVAPEEAAALWSTYCTLNRITHQELIAKIVANGFKILRTFTTTQELEPPASLLNIFHREVLLTNQVVVLASTDNKGDSA